MSSPRLVLLAMVDANGNEISDGGSLEIVLLHEDTNPEEVGQLPTAQLRLAALDQEWSADREQLEAYPDQDPAISKIDELHHQRQFGFGYRHLL